MPIRINLLAEAQANEELRRRDPVKRAIILGAACVAVMVVASLFIQSQVMSTNRKADGYSRLIADKTNDYAAVMADHDRLQQLNLNIRGLDLLAAERLLNGTLLNSLQKVYVENVQLIRLHAEHNYTVTEETKSKPSATTPGPAKVLKPATSSEKITLLIEARDTSANPGDQVTKFKDTLGKSDYFLKLLGGNNQMRLVNRSPPQLQPDTGRLGVQFTLEARLPEKVRLDISSPVRQATPASAAKPPAPKPVNEEPSL